MLALKSGFMHSDEKRLLLAALLDVRADLPPPERYENALCSREPYPALQISAP